MNDTLKKLLYNHNNNYNFNPIDVLTFKEFPLPKNLSVIIPYYNTGEIINVTLKHLYNSLNKVSEYFPNWKFEVILVDDGSSVRPANKYLDKNKWPNLKLEILSENLGRTSARNKGLKLAKLELCLFMDSDILIDNQLISNHLKIHTYNEQLNRKKSISVSFFDFRDYLEEQNSLDFICPHDLRLNDYRLFCTFGEDWWGCQEDKKYINKSFSIIKDTNNFRNWEYKYKAWVLPNMILGGFFIVDRFNSIIVGSFDESFRGYGFTETSLPTKLIANFNDFVIPVLIGGGIHIKDEEVNVKQSDKCIIFREKHDYYFNKYLNLSLKNAIRN
jgi:glycosyltransferase involved in cell wall biosynthesis